MIFYTITDTLPVVPDWSSITGDLKAGTPISIKGAVANDEAAIGLVAGDTAHGAEYAVVVTAGVVDLNAASASYGSTVSDDVVQALDNVTFIYGGKVYAVTGSSLPDYSEASDGDVLSIEDGAPAWKEPSGGGGGDTLVVTITQVEFGVCVLDKTDAEILAAVSDGKVIFARWMNYDLLLTGIASVYGEDGSITSFHAEQLVGSIDSETGYGYITCHYVDYAYGSWSVSDYNIGRSGIEGEPI